MFSFFSLSALGLPENCCALASGWLHLTASMYINCDCANAHDLHISSVLLLLWECERAQYSAIVLIQWHALSE
jgi:hypothetical protein